MMLTLSFKTTEATSICHGLLLSMTPFSIAIRIPHKEIDYSVQKLLRENHLHIVRRIGPVAILDSTGYWGTGAVSIIQNLKRPKGHGRLAIRYINDPRTQDKLGVIVYVINKKTQEIVFVGVPEGSEERKPRTLATAAVLLRDGFQATFSSGIEDRANQARFAEPAD
jgi:hypothetical protein